MTTSQPMARRIASIAVLLCAVQATLCQTFDCATRSGQLAFLQNGAESDPACYNPVIDLISGINPTPAQIEDMIPPGTDVPSGFEIDVTDPMLYNACGVPLPEMCESQSDRVTSAAPSLALPPLVALLFGTLLAKLFP